jgi:hypothetical protein
VVLLALLHLKDSQLKSFIIFRGFGITASAEQIENIPMELCVIFTSLGGTDSAEYIENIPMELCHDLYQFRWHC